MAWNPYADGEAILADYYRRGFGQAAGAINAYWTLMEESATEILMETSFSRGSGVETMSKVWNEDLFYAAQAHLDHASTIVENEAEVYAKRINFLRSGLEYAKVRLEIAIQQAQLRELPEGDQAIAQKIRAHWKTIAEGVDKAPPYAFNTRSSNFSRALRDARASVD